jgi:peptide/nickel transport system permease protein
MPGWTRAFALPERGGALCLLGFVLLALLAPWLAPFDPTALDPTAPLQPPNAHHWFGTDLLGRDLFSRLLWGGRVTLTVAGLGLGLALGSGTALGLLSGYVGGWVDGLLMRLVDIWLALPTFLLLLSLSALLGPGPQGTILGLALAATPAYARLVRGSVLALRHEPYLLAAQAVGVPPIRLLTHHLLPPLGGLLAVYGTTGLGAFILAGAGLGFLGLGVQPPAPEWGAMLHAGLPYMRDAWWLSLFPGLALFLVVLSINLVGEGIRRAQGAMYRW